MKRSLHFSHFGGFTFTYSPHFDLCLQYLQQIDLCTTPFSAALTAPGSISRPSLAFFSLSILFYSPSSTFFFHSIYIFIYSTNLIICLLNLSLFRKLDVPYTYQPKPWIASQLSLTHLAFQPSQIHLASQLPQTHLASQLSQIHQR